MSKFSDNSLKFDLALPGKKINKIKTKRPKL